jgi:hypothetical protein
MAVVALQEAAAGNQNVSFGAAANGDTVASGVLAAGWELPVILLVRNTDAANKTVTVDGVNYVIPLTTGFGVIPIRAGSFNSPKLITYSALTGVTVAAVRLARSD